MRAHRFKGLAVGAILSVLTVVGCQGDLEVERFLSAGKGSGDQTGDSAGADSNTDTGQGDGGADSGTGGQASSSTDSGSQTGGGDAGSGDASTSGVGDGGAEEPAPATVSFVNHIQPIFNSYCIRCHVTGGFANLSGIPLKLVEGSSYRLLVNQSSSQRPDLKLVQPTHPDNSLLYMKLTQDPPPVGVRMPWDRGPAPTEEEVQKIRTWIEEGAQFN